MPFNAFVRRGLLPITSSITSSRIFWYSCLSTVASLVTIANACKNYNNFYSVTVYLSRSGRSLLVLANTGFILALACGTVLQRIFFGPLQPREVERLYDQTWMFVTESLLAFTIFRDDFDIPFVIMFGFLLFIKCFHWLLADRVESMDQVPFPGPPLLFHLRLHALFVILWLVDIVMLVLAIDSTMANGVGGAVLFANEYAILTASALNSMARYLLSSIEIRRARTRGGANAPAWENKSMYVFYIELVTDFLKLSTYLTFFAVVLTFYGLPLNIIRDVYLTARSFITRLRALVRYHNATRDMDRRYPNATEEELTAMSDRTCIICREEMIATVNNNTNPADNQAPNDQPANPVQDGPNVTPKKLPCGHIFHFQCLRSWLERQQSCPTCRRPVLETDQGNGNAAQGGARGARQPGQQQPNAAPQVPPGQLAANGALGWLGRFFGVALQPPLVPGQFPNGQLAPPLVPAAQPGQQPFPANAGWPAPGQQPPPGYGWPYPYQMMPPMPPQQLQPPPVYRGFYGPGGVWYPWGPEAQAQGQQAQATSAQAQPSATQPLSGSSGAEAVPTHITDPSPAPGSSNTGIDSAQAPQSAVPSAQDAGLASSSGGDDTRSSAREAAALAALRRFNSSSLSSGTRSNDSRSVDTTPAAAAATDSTSVAPPVNGDVASGPQERRQPLEPSSAPASASSPASIPSAAPDDRPQAPPLIPLWDPAQQAQQARASMYPWQQMPVTWPQQTAGQRLPPAQAPQPTRPPASSALRTSAQDSRFPARQMREPLSQLPATLTEEQLTRLDRLTREAIDERLRVLEGVSGTIWRCIQELHRMRSVLPAREGDASAPTPTEGNAPTDPAPAAGSSSSQATSTDKGKGVNTANTADLQDTGASSSTDRPVRSMSILD